MKHHHRTPREWYNDHEKWIWRGGLAAAWIASLWLSSNFIGKVTYWKNYQKQQTHNECIRERLIVIEERLKIKRKKPNAEEHEEDE